MVEQDDSNFHEPDTYTPNNADHRPAGLWIPISILLNKKLNMVQRCLLSIIYHLSSNKNKACFAFNEYFSLILGISGRSIQSNLVILKSKGFISATYPVGSPRLITVSPEIIQRIEEDIKRREEGEARNMEGRSTQHGDPIKENIINNSFTKVKENVILPSGKLRLPKSSLSKKKRRHIVKRKRPPIGKRKRRHIDVIDKKTRQVIDDWNSQGSPFAKVVKLKPVAKAIKPYLKKDPILLYNPIIKAHKYFSNSDSILNGSKIRCLDFFKPNKYSYQGQWLKEHKFKNWFEVFATKTPAWLESHVLKNPRDVVKYSQEIYDAVCTTLQIAPANREDDITIKRLSNRIQEWLIANNTNGNQWPIIEDFEYFLKDKYPDSNCDPRWFTSKNFWNTDFNKYLVQIGRFKHISQINRI